MRRKQLPNKPAKQDGQSASSWLRYGAISVVSVVLVTAIAVVALRGPKHADRPVPPIPSSQELLDEVAVALEAGDLDRAETLLDAAQRQDIDNGTAWLYRGQLARQRGNLDLALESWQNVPDAAGKLGGTARFLEATVLLDQRLARDAEQRLVKATTLNPTYLPPHERLLALYVLQMRTDATRQQLERIQNLRELSLEELVLKTRVGEQITESEQAIEMLGQFSAADPFDFASSVSLARYLIAAERPDDANALISRLVAGRVMGRWLDDDELHCFVFEALLALDRVKDARALLKKHDPSDSTLPAVWQCGGMLADAEGDFQRAADCFQHAAILSSLDRAKVYRVGLLFRQLGQEEEAQTFLARAALLDRLRQKTTLAARADRRKTDLLLPVLVEIGDLLAQLEQHADAANWYRIALSINPKDNHAVAGLQRAYQALQRLQANDTGRQVATVAPATNLRQPGHEPKRAESHSTTSPLVPPNPPATRVGRIALRDVHQEVGLDFEYFNGQTKFKYLIEAMGGGVAVLDYDGDGWPDLHFPQGCRLPVDPQDRSHGDRLFRNTDGQSFVEVTKFAGLSHHGYGQGAVAGDFDSDGFVDVIVAQFGRNVAYRNNGDGTFSDVTDVVGFRHERMSSSLALIDLDRDGDLDLYVVNYVDSLKVCRNANGEFSTCRPESFNGEQDELYLNRGDGVFEDVTAAAGIVVSDGKGLGVVTADLDGDGWPDIYVTNDTTPNFLFQNQGTAAGPKGQGRLVEKGLISGAGMSGEGRAEAGMGVACADLNGDLNLDLFVTNYFNESNTAYFNQGEAFFEDVSRARGLAAPSLPLVGFGTQAMDLDLDGWLDLLVANGHIDDFGDRDQAWKMPTQVYRNLGGGRFAEVSQAAGEYFHGEYLGRGVARLDWNRDGRPDLVVVHQDAPAALLQNETNDAGDFAILELHGVHSNRDAIGAKIRVTAGGRTQFVEICGGDGFYSSNERRQIIGLGDATTIERLEITWPNGKTDRWGALPSNCELVIVEGQVPRVRPPKGK